MNTIWYEKFSMSGENSLKSGLPGFARWFALLLLITGVILGAGSASAAVTYQAAGTAVAGTTVTGIGASPTWPAHALNDIALLFVESTGGQAVTLAVPNGFVPVSSSPQATGAGTAGTQITVFWARATSAAMPAPRIATPSDHFYARIVTFRGVINTGDPVDAALGGVKAAASGSVTLTGVTTTVANALIVQAVARDNDSAAAAFSAQTNANLTGITERLDAGTTNGNGGGLGIWAGVKATAGATGNTTATVTSSINAFITIALKPQSGPRFQAAGGAVGGAATVNPAWPAHAVDDIALLFVESAGGEAATLSTPAGFVPVLNSPQASGAGTAGTRLTVFWARATSAAMATPRVADSGNHVYAQILTYRNVANTGNPWDVTGGGAKAPASTSVSVSGVTTTMANTLVVQAVARDNDLAAAAFSAQTNANLANITERSDAGTTQQNGGGFAIWDGAKATAGATGSTTANVTSSINAFLTIALAPSATPAPVYQGLGAAVTTGLNWPAHAIDDVALLFVESPGGQAVTLLDAAGFAPVLNSPQATGAATNGTQITVFWARATSTTMVGPTLTGPADHAYARILTYRGVINTGNPWDVTGGGTKASPSTSVTVTGVTTTVANTLIVQAVARDNDSAAAAFSAETNAALTGITERNDAGSTTGNGGGFGVWDGAKATVGATGNTTATVTSSRNAFLTVALKPPLAGPNHYELSLPTSGISCLPVAATVTACADASSPCTNKYTAVSGTDATLSNTGGTLAATTLTFAATGVASTTLSYPAATDGATATVTLSGVPTAAVNANQCCPDGVSCVVANSCSITFNTAGFIFSGAADDVAATIPAQVAGITSGTYYLRAVKTSTTTKACESALSGANSVNFAYECNDPATCYGADLMSVNGGTATTIARNNNGSVSSYTSVAMSFDANGNAPFTFNYSDVGKVTLHVSKAAGGSLLSALTGSSNAFVVAPHHFGFSGISAGPIKSGNNFIATVTAYNGLATPTATPSFGKELAAESTTIAFTKCEPTGVNAVNGSFSGNVGSFNNGEASASNLNWSEVGNGDLIATLASASYLGSGLTASGNSGTSGTVCNGGGAGNVGAFIPDHFITTVTDGCAGCGFTYSGQPFTVVVTAQNGLATPGTTVNYDGTANTAPNFANNVSLTDANAAAVGKFGVSASPMGVTVNVAGDTLTVPKADFVSGVATLASVPTYTFNLSPTAPTVIKVRAVDAINSSASSSGFTEGTTEIRSGRIKISNSYGSELLPLPMTATVQFYNALGGWVTSTTDSVTGFNTATNIVAAIVKGPLASVSVKSAGPVTVLGGKRDFTLNSPGVTGSADISLNAPAYLPSLTGRATFGVYKGNNNFIYQREAY